MERVWNKAKDLLKENMDEKSYVLWIKPLRFLASDETSISIGCPNKFSRNWVQDNYAVLLGQMLSNVGLNGHRLDFKVLSNIGLRESPASESNGKQLTLPSMPKRIKAGDRYLNSRFTFDRFVVGQSNEFAYSVSNALAHDSYFSYTSLFLLAQTGLGKSHLIQAIGNAILQRKPASRVIYITTEDFTNEMVFALRNNLIDQFKNKYRRVCDVLLLEELNFLSGKEKTQIELAYTLDTLYNEGKMVIFTSPLKPEEIPGMKKMLTSRLTSGVITSIEKPGFHTRVEILNQKAKERNISVPEEVAGFIAENITQDIRQIEGSLDSLQALSHFLKKEIDIDMAKETVKQLLPAHHLATVEDIQKIVCKYFKVEIEMLISKSRKKTISYPRSIAIYLCRRYTQKPLETIGRFFNRNHSTILYDDEKIKRTIKTDDNLKREVEFLCREIEAKG